MATGLRNLDAFAAAQEKKYGEEKIRNRYPPVIVPTGSMSLDRALRVGGWYLGQVYEVLGNKDAGKSTLGIASLIEHQRMFPDRAVGYINMENTFDPDRATAMGLDCSDRAKAEGRWAPRLPDHSEDVSDMLRDLVGSGLFSCVLLDSIGAMESDKVLSKSAEDAVKQMGINARIITQMTKAIATLARNNRCTVIFINQPRAPIGQMAMNDVSAGPKLLQHATTSKLEMRALGGEEDVRWMKLPGEDDKLKVSIRSRIRVPRLKSGLPGRVAECFINLVGTEPYGPPGIDTADECVSVGVREGVIEQAGGWYTLPGGDRFQGREKLTAAIRADEGLRKLIRSAISFETPTDLLTEMTEES